MVHFGDSRLYITERETRDSTGTNDSTIVGNEYAISPNAKVYSEYQWQHGDAGQTETRLLGMRRQWGQDKGLKFLLSGEYADVYGSATQTRRYAAALGLSYDGGARWKASTRDEFRREYGAVNRNQLLSTNFVEYKLNPDFSLLGKYHYSVTENIDSGVAEGDLNETSIGVAYRPVASDRFNALGRVTRIGDRRPLAAGEVSQLARSNGPWNWDEALNGWRSLPTRTSRLQIRSLVTIAAPC